MFTLVCHISGDFYVGGTRNTGQIIAVCCYKPGETGGLYRDAKSPVSGGRLRYLDVRYSLLYSRTYLLFSRFTSGTSGGDCHTHAGEAAVLLLDRQAHHCLLIYVVLAQICDAQDVAQL